MRSDPWCRAGRHGSADHPADHPCPGRGPRLRCPREVGDLVVRREAGHRPATPWTATPAPLVVGRHDTQWLQVDLGHHGLDLEGRPQLGGRLRQGLQDPGLPGRQQLERPEVRHRRRRRRRHARCLGPGPLCAHVRRPSGHPMGLLALGVPGVRHHRWWHRTHLRHGERREGQARLGVLHGERQHPASAAFDGDAGTRWSSQASDPQWVQADLGSVQDLCKVDLTWEAAYAKEFQIQASTDGQNWTALKSVTGATGGSASYDVSGSGRYVRINGTVRGTGYGYSLWEVAVHTGSSTTPPCRAVATSVPTSSWWTPRRPTSSRSSTRSSPSRSPASSAPAATSSC